MSKDRGHLVIRYNDVNYDLPNCSINRKTHILQPLKDLQKETFDGTVLNTRVGFKYIEDFEFKLITETERNYLLLLHNAEDEFLAYPFEDNPARQFVCRITDLEIKDGDGNKTSINRYTAKVKLEHSGYIDNDYVYSYRYPVDSDWSLGTKTGDIDYLGSTIIGITPFGGGYWESPVYDLSTYTLKRIGFIRGTGIKIYIKQDTVNPITTSYVEVSDGQRVFTTTGRYLQVKLEIATVGTIYTMSINYQ